MTKKELSQLYYLNREIVDLQTRIEELKAKTENCTAFLTGLPRGSVHVDLKDELIDLIDLLNLKQKECIIERSRLERYINSIDDSLIRQIFTLRYISGLTWLQVALHIGGNNTENGVRMLHNRFLSKK